MLNPGEGSLRGSMLCFTILIMLCPMVSEAKTSTDFANGFANGLYEAMGGCTEGLNSVLIYGVKSDGESPFEFNPVDFAASVVGLVVVPIFTIFICCGFCCGRCFQGCKCCCKPCGAEHCGGKLPTKDVYPGWEKAVTWGLLALSWIAIFSFAIVGYASFVDFKTYWEELVDGGVDLYGGPSLVKGDISGAITKIKTDATGFINGEVNPLFDGLDPVRNNLQNLELNLTSLKTAMEELQRYIEGCDTTAAGWTDGSCSSTGSNFHTACTPQQEEHYDTGEGVVMSDGSIAPNCQANLAGDPGPCPCCADCAQVIVDIQTVIDSLPSQESIDELDQPLDTTQIDADVDEALGDWEAQIDSFEESNEPLKWLHDNQDDVKGYLGSGRVEGGAALFFLLPIIMCILILVALVLQAIGTKTDMPGYIWWTAFTIGVIHFVIIISPSWGAFSLFAIPYGTVCEEPTGTSYDVTVERFLSDCLFDGTKFIWPLVDPPIERATISDNLAAFNARDKIDSAAIDEVLTDVDDYTAAYNEDDIDGLNSEENKQAFNIARDCSAFPGAAQAECDAYVARMRTYESDIDARIDTIKLAGANVQALVDSTKELAANFKVDIDRIFVRTDELLEGMVDTAWDVGKCTRFNSLYVGVADPYNGILDAFIATWAALFMIFIFTPVMLCSMCHGAKIMYRGRHPDDYVAGGEHVKSDGAPDARNELTSVVPPMPNNGIQTKGNIEQPGSLVYPSTGTPTNPGLSDASGMPPMMSPQTTFAEERPFSEDNVTAPTAPVFFDAYNGAPQSQNLYGNQQQQHIYPYVDAGMA